jgi:tetratricopeptide (TPR) repeat protein
MIVAMQPKSEENGRESRWMQHGILGAVCALVIGVYAYTASSGYVLSRDTNPANEHYNLLVKGFRAGQLNLEVAVPPGLARLPDPYDPTAYARYHTVDDMSFYKGRLYLYFGVTPALILLWPFAAVTGRYLSERLAVLLFCGVGFLTGVSLLRAIWRRYFSEVGIWVVAACALALGLATAVPVLLPRAAYTEVAISCGYMLAMLALAAVWHALHEPGTQMRSGWLAAASLAYGLAVGARPSLLFGAAILLAPVVQDWREHRPQHLMWELMGAFGPIALVGLGLMLYNWLRFDNPFEFGVRYQLTGYAQPTAHGFSVRNLWFNFRVYFLERPHWTGRFPFVHEPARPPPPTGYARVEKAFGVPANVPIVWLALAAPLAWRRRLGQGSPALRWFVVTVALLFGICALTVLLFCSAVDRYEVDFLPGLLLLAVLGVFSVERTLACRPFWSFLIRLVWIPLSVVSVAFCLFQTTVRCAEPHYKWGIVLMNQGRLQEAIGHYEQALRLNPDFPEAHYDWGNALMNEGRLQEAIGHYEQALRINPDFAKAHNNWGDALMNQGRLQEAIGHYEQALRLNPDYAEAHYNLGLALEKMGSVTDAIPHLERALQLNPDLPSAHNHLGNDLAQVGRLPEAVQHLELALQSNPDSVDAHYNLGLVLAQLGRLPEAIDHWKHSLQLDPDFSEAHYNLGLALEKLARTQEAIQHYEQALRINPDFAEAHNSLGILLARTGKVDAAIEHFRHALQINPDYGQARHNLDKALAQRAAPAK